MQKVQGYSFFDQQKKLLKQEYGYGVYIQYE